MMSITKISIWFFLSTIASAGMAIVFLWLSGYANSIENEYYQSEGINIAYAIALPIIPAFVGGKFAQDWGPTAINRKLEWFVLINVIINTILLMIVQIKYGFNLLTSIYLIMVCICTFIVFQVENEDRSST
jgi:peptidoglycan/LPS O-acetylase OafA/YrhL